MRILGHRPVRVVYISPNGVGTPLVRSQVLPYLRGLAHRGIDAELVTFERGDPYPTGEFPVRSWHGLRPRAGHGLLAKLLDIARGVWLVARLTVASGAQLVHARSHLPAAIGAIVSFITGRPLIFDMRGFLPDEYLDAGVWSSTDLRYRALRLAERLLLRYATEVVVLTHRAAAVLREEKRYASAIGTTPITVIPCCVDLRRFAPGPTRETVATLVYSGSLGMWYLLEEMLAVYRAARRHVPSLRLLILNRGEHDVARAAIRDMPDLAQEIELRVADPIEMPKLLARCHVGIALIRASPSKRGSSPVKVAEYLACGLPVVVNSGIGDTDRLVTTYGAGHVIQVLDEAGLDAAGLAVARLLEDNVVRNNARRLAEAQFDVTTGIERYAQIYERVLGPMTARR